MLETFTSLGAGDFQQRYTSSYGYYTVPETKRRILVQVQDVSARVMGFIDSRGTGYQAHSDTGVEFEFIPAKKKLFTHGNVLYFICRRPARQWTRGITDRNTSLVALGESKTEQHLSFDTVIAAFAAEPVDVVHSVLALESKESNVAVLSDMFGVRGSVLYLYDQIIGSFMADRREIIVEEAMFKQEIEDLVALHQLPYKVIGK